MVRLRVMARASQDKRESEGEGVRPSPLSQVSAESRLSFRVLGLGFRVQGLGFRTRARARARVRVMVLRLESGFRVRVQGQGEGESQGGSV